VGKGVSAWHCSHPLQSGFQVHFKDQSAADRSHHPLHLPGLVVVVVVAKLGADVGDAVGASVANVGEEVGVGVGASVLKGSTKVLGSTVPIVDSQSGQLPQVWGQ